MGLFSRKKKGKRGDVITIEEAEERGLYQAIKDGDPEKMDRMLERMTRKPKKDPPPTDKERADNERLERAVEVHSGRRGAKKSEKKKK